MNTVVLITTGQPSVNPRVVKEADALQAAGYQVTVLYCYWIEWAQRADEQLLREVRWNFQLIGGTPSTNKFLYFFTKARNKVNTILNRNGHNTHLIAERTQARCYDELLAAAKAIKADVYIGHNLGALPVAIKAAAYNKAGSGFDFEDYHRAENEGLKEAFARRIVYLEEKYVPALQYISASSEQIENKVKEDFPFLKTPFLTLFNCFSLKDQPAAQTQTTPGILKLFWFSQMVGKGRGLETVVEAMRLINDPSIQLTLVGRCDNATATFIRQLACSVKDSIHFAGIIAPQQLPAFASTFDVGLATETAVPLNRNICLTNKIFTYLLAGNCIIASDTNAQKSFFSRYNHCGVLYRNRDAEDLAEKIKFLYDNKSLVEQYKENAYALAADKLNWEAESKKLIDTIATITN